MIQQTAKATVVKLCCTPSCSFASEQEYITRFSHASGRIIHSEHCPGIIIVICGRAQESQEEIRPGPLDAFSTLSTRIVLWSWNARRREGSSVPRGASRCPTQTFIIRASDRTEWVPIFCTDANRRALLGASSAERKDVRLCAWYFEHLQEIAIHKSGKRIFSFPFFSIVVSRSVYPIANTLTVSFSPSFVCSYSVCKQVEKAIFESTSGIFE